jgi:hypothetical protein
VIVTLLLLLRSLDNPFHGGVGGLQPVAMNRSLRLMDQVLPNLDAKVRVPCTPEGVRTRT